MKVEPRAESNKEAAAETALAAKKMDSADKNKDARANQDQIATEPA